MPRKETDVVAELTGQTVTTEIPTEGKLDRSALRDDMEVIPNEVVMNDMAEALAFMEEPIKVIVHDSADLNAEPIVELNVNGINQYIIRGQEQVIKRKYVEVLARARRVATKTVTGVQGDRVVNQVSQHSAVRYPFSVIEDPNPRGRAWLKGLMERA